MPEIVSAATRIGEADGFERLRFTINFASSVMTAIDQPLVERLNSITAGAAAPVGEDERAFAQAGRNPTFVHLARMLEKFGENPSRRIFRPDLLAVMIDAMRRTTEGSSLKATVTDVRESERSSGRAVPKIGIGSTLLLKGLEAEHAIILDASTMNACNAYVALSRASRSIFVLSSKGTIGG